MGIGALALAFGVAYAASTSPAFTSALRVRESQASDVATGQYFPEVVLSAPDNAVLHLSFFASDLFVSVGTESKGRSGGVKRVISFAGYATVGDDWQTVLTHLFETLDASSTQSLLFSTGYSLSPNPGWADYNVAITPKPSFTWGTVRDADDMDFEPKLTAVH